MTKEAILAYPVKSEINWELIPIYKGMPGPWHVACLAFIRGYTISVALPKRFFIWFPDCKALADATCETILRVLVDTEPYKAVLAKRISRFAKVWNLYSWQTLSDIPGSNQYIRDCVGYFCFGINPNGKKLQNELGISV